MPEVTSRPTPDIAPSTLSLARGTRHPFFPRDELPPTGTALSRPEGRSKSQGEPLKQDFPPYLLPMAAPAEQQRATAADGETRQAPSATAPFRFLPRTTAAAASAHAPDCGHTAPRLQLPSCSAAKEMITSMPRMPSMGVCDLLGVVVLLFSPS